VLFRHKEKFHRPTAVGILMGDDIGKDEFAAKIEKIGKLRFTRVGEEIGVNLVALENESGNESQFAERAEELARTTGLPVVLVAENPASLEAALAKIGATKPLLCGATEGNWSDIATLAKKYECPVVIRASTLGALASLADELKKAGVDQLVLDPGLRETLPCLEQLTKLRRLAVDKVFRPLGYPTIAFTEAASPFQEALQAATYICKYANVLITKLDEPWQLLPLLTVRQNIYTDPQVPNAIEPKLYEVGSPQADSPVIVTTNFSLTYFTVQSEVENSRVPTYISVVETEGMGVLNAYAGDKWSAEKIAKTLDKQGVREKVNHGTIIIPGLVAVFRAELIDEFGWQVIVGPEEAARIPGFLKGNWKPE
jgi:acetyl-CoA decarbonylase/synthase complex subunit gamma